MDFFAEQASFDSNSKDEDRGTPSRRRHSLDLSSPHHGAGNNYKRYKQSHSLPHEYNAPLPSFGSNTSDLTPIPVGTGKTPKTVPLKPNSSPMPMDTNIFQTPPRMYLNPKATTMNGISPQNAKRSMNGISFADVKRKKLTLPPQLVPDDKEGRRLVVICGSSKKCTDTRVDERNTKKLDQPMTKELKVKMPTSNGHFTFLKSIYPALEGCTFLLPGLKIRIEQRKPFNVPGMEIHVSSFGSFKLGHERLPDGVSIRHCSCLHI